MAQRARLRMSHPVPDRFGARSDRRALVARCGVVMVAGLTAYSGYEGARGGFGLGLAIVRDAVRSLGGKIEIDSEPGRATMRVTVAFGRPM